MVQELRSRYWGRVKWLTSGLLLLWLLVSLAGPWFARNVENWHAWGLASMFLIAAQGGLVFFLLIVIAYVLAMDRADASYLQAVANAHDDAPPERP